MLIVKGDILWAFQGMKKPFSLKNIDLDVRKVGGECHSQSSNVLTVLFFYNWKSLCLLNFNVGWCFVILFFRRQNYNANYFTLSLKHLGIKGILIMKFMTLPPSGPHGQGQTFKNSLYSHKCERDLITWLWCPWSSLYKKFMTPGPRVQALGLGQYYYIMEIY